MLIVGAFRAAILVAYLLAIGFVPNVHRLFRYHGAVNAPVREAPRANYPSPPRGNES